MIEAMACGTPVIAFRAGSVPEVIDDGVTGFIVADEDEAVAATKRLHQLDRATVRATFDRRWTARRMAEDYVDLYRALASPSLAAARCSRLDRFVFVPLVPADGVIGGSSHLPSGIEPRRCRRRSHLDGADCLIPLVLPGRRRRYVSRRAQRGARAEFLCRRDADRVRPLRVGLAGQPGLVADRRRHRPQHRHRGRALSGNCRAAAWSTGCTTSAPSPRSPSPWSRSVR